MTEDRQPVAPTGSPARETGTLLLAAGGLAAAFGAASCCALPLLLGSLGFGSAWLVAVAWISAPHRIALLAAATVSLLAGGGLLVANRRRAMACAPAAGCARPALSVVASGVLSLTAILIVLGVLYG